MLVRGGSTFFRARQLLPWKAPEGKFVLPQLPLVNIKAESSQVCMSLQVLTEIKNKDNAVWMQIQREHIGLSHSYLGLEGRHPLVRAK